MHQPTSCRIKFNQLVDVREFKRTRKTSSGNLTQAENAAKNKLDELSAIAHDFEKVDRKSNSRLKHSTNRFKRRIWANGSVEVLE
jgi:hypothetical protein